MRINNYVVIGLIVTVIVMGAAIVYMVTRKNNDDDKVTSTPPISAPTLVLFHANWCPHCRDMMGSWRRVVEILGQNPNGVKAVDMESSDPRMKRYGITSFPTIRLYPQGLENVENFMPYSGDRQSPESMVNFALGRVQEEPPEQMMPPVQENRNMDFEEPAKTRTFVATNQRYANLN